MPLSKTFTTVTPLSKSIALILFVSLPFIGFYLGAKFQKSITVCNSFVPIVTNTVSTPTIAQNVSDIISIAFNDQTINLEQKNTSPNSNNFLGLPSESFNSRSTTLSQLYDSNGDWSNLKFHDLDTDKYYVLQPGGNTEISLATATDIKKMLGVTTINNGIAAATSTKTDCTNIQKKVGQINATAVTCKSTSYFTANKSQIVDESATTNCYLPISNDKYLAIKQLVKPVGTNIDMCQTLIDLGYQSLSVTKN